MLRSPSAQDVAAATEHARDPLTAYACRVSAVRCSISGTLTHGDRPREGAAVGFEGRHRMFSVRGGGCVAFGRCRPPAGATWCARAVSLCVPARTVADGGLDGDRHGRGGAGRAAATAAG